MNVLLQRHCAKYIYAVPDGLRELMSDITREVLRSQPENLYTFVADYLDALMITRENARVAARLVEHIAEISITIVNLLLRTGMTREEADAVARIIQNAFRRYLQRKEKIKIAEVLGLEKEDEVLEGESLQEFYGDEDEEEQFVNEVLQEADIAEDYRHNAARIIQAAYRKFKRRQELEKDLLYGMVDWRIAARHTISLYRHAGVSEWEANRAATLIKAAYKGYYTRRVMRKLLEKGMEEEAEGLSDRSSESSEKPAAWSIHSVPEMEDDEEQKKLVRINFDTVIPHVDFDEPTVIATQASLAAGIIVMGEDDIYNEGTTLDAIPESPEEELLQLAEENIIMEQQMQEMEQPPDVAIEGEFLAVEEIIETVPEETVAFAEELLPEPEVVPESLPPPVEEPIPEETAVLVEEPPPSPEQFETETEAVTDTEGMTISGENTTDYTTTEEG